MLMYRYFRMWKLRSEIWHFYRPQTDKSFMKIKDHREPLLMLRGLGRSSWYWLGYDEILAEHFRVITVDHRGIGRSTVPQDWNDSIDDIAGDVIQVLEELQISRVHIFGFLSLGGMVAMSMAISDPDLDSRFGDSQLIVG